MFRRFDSADFNAHIDGGFLDSVAGPKGMRTNLSVGQVERAANLVSQIQALTAESLPVLMLRRCDPAEVLLAVS
jgi:hypothetical protein